MLKSGSRRATPNGMGPVDAQTSRLINRDIRRLQPSRYRIQLLSRCVMLIGFSRFIFDTCRSEIAKISFLDVDTRDSSRFRALQHIFYLSVGKLRKQELLSTLRDII